MRARCYVHAVDRWTRRDDAQEAMESRKDSGSAGATGASGDKGDDGSHEAEEALSRHSAVEKRANGETQVFYPRDCVLQVGACEGDSQKRCSSDSPS